MNYWLHEQAEAELSDAASYYAASANTRIAKAFLEEFARVIGLLELNQQLGTLKDGGMRAYQFRRFPFSLVYREDQDAGPQVYAVAHQSREVGYWRTRI